MTYFPRAHALNIDILYQLAVCKMCDCIYQGKLVESVTYPDLLESLV